MSDRFHGFFLGGRFRSFRILLPLLAASLLGPTTAEARKHPRKLLHIRSISVAVKNVFDPSVPGENIWPYRWADALHIRTRPSIILNQLLVKPGDVVDPELLEESERNLRALTFIKDATIVVVPAPDNQVDLIVETQDSWTFQPQLNFGSAGGQNHFSAGLLEENVLGYGKTLSYFYRENPQGVGNQFTYQDPQIGATRLQVSTQFVASATDNEEHLTFGQPFYSLGAPLAGTIAFDHVVALQQTFQNGNEINEYDQHQLHVEPFVGARLNNDLLNVQRLNLNYLYLSNTYTSTGRTAAGQLPDDLTQTGPMLTWTLQQTEFVKEHFIDNAYRVEDINLGHQVSIDSGYSCRFLGATNNTVPLGLSDAFGFGNEPVWFGLASYGMLGRYNTYATDQTGGRLFNTLYFGNLNLYRHWETSFPFTGVIHLEGAQLQNPDTNNVLQLGGDTGLRGFKANSFTGNKSMLVNLENRFYYPREVLHLAYVGGAFFADAGQVQPEGLPFDRKDFHADIGAGLRFALTRSSAGGTVFRVDVAYAVGPIQQSNRILLSVSAGQGFNRSGNTYGKYPGVPVL